MTTQQVEESTQTKLAARILEGLEELMVDEIRYDNAPDWDLKLIDTLTQMLTMARHLSAHYEQKDIQKVYG